MKQYKKNLLRLPNHSHYQNLRRRSLLRLQLQPNHHLRHHQHLRPCQNCLQIHLLYLELKQYHQKFEYHLRLLLQEDYHRLIDYDLLYQKYLRRHLHNDQFSSIRLHRHHQQQLIYHPIYNNQYLKFLYKYFLQG